MRKTAGTKQAKSKKISTPKTAGKISANAASAEDSKPATSPRKQAQMNEMIKKWEGLFERSEAIPTQKYSMKQNYERQTGLDHTKLGWGFIMESKNGRLEVLFKDGIKQLVANYK